MLTRSDCWEPLDRAGFHYLRGKPDTGRMERREVDRAPSMPPAPVDRVIRAIRGCQAR